MLLGVKHLMRDIRLAQQIREILGGLDRGCTHQCRLLALMAILDVLDNRLVFFLGAEIDQISQILPLHWPVGGDHHHFQAIDLLEFIGLGIGRTGHTRKFLIETEIVLESNRCQGLILTLYRYPFLRLYRLVQPIGPAPSRHGAAGKLINDNHLAIADNVIDIFLKQHMGTQCRIKVMHQVNVSGVIERLTFGQ